MHQHAHERQRNQERIDIARTHILALKPDVFVMLVAAQFFRHC